MESRVEESRVEEEEGGAKCHSWKGRYSYIVALHGGTFRGLSFVNARFIKTVGAPVFAAVQPAPVEGAEGGAGEGGHGWGGGGREEMEVEEGTAVE